MKKRVAFLFFILLIAFPALACQSSTTSDYTPTPVETDACCLNEPFDLQATLEADQVEAATLQPSQTPDIPAPVMEPVSGLESGWYAYTNANVVRDLTIYQGVLYAATLGGMVSWRMDSQRYTRYTPLDGMSHVSAYSIVACEIPEARILVGTLNGFSIFNPQTGLWNQDVFHWQDDFTGKKIERIVCDQANQRLLIGHQGLAVLDLQTGDIKQFTTQDGLPWNAVSDIAVHDEVIWLATGYKGLAKISGDQVTAYAVKDGLADERVQSLAFDSQGTLWIGAASGIFSNVAGKWGALRNDPLAGLADINEIEIGQDGQIWVATASISGGKVCQFDPLAGSCVIEQMDERKLPILAMTLSESGLPVYGTSDGVSVIENGAARDFLTDDLLVSNFVDALMPGQDGKLWIGTDAGVQRIDPADPITKWQTFRQKDNPEMGGDWVSAFAVGADQSIWATMINGSASRFHNGAWTAFQDVYSFNNSAVDLKGHIWLGDDGKGLVVVRPDGSLQMKMTAADGLPGDNVQAILVDRAGFVWIGTDRGLARYADGELQVIFDPKHPGLPNNYVRALAMDADGGLIIGTFTGVARYDGNRIEVLVDFLSTGFDQARLTNLAVAPSGRVWVGTDHGLLFSDDYDNWTMLTTRDGLLTDRISALCVDQYGAVWVGGGGSNFDGGGLLQIVP